MFEEIINAVMDNETGPVSVYEPDECSQALVDKFYLAILRGKLKTTRKFIDGGGKKVCYCCEQYNNVYICLLNIFLVHFICRSISGNEKPFRTNPTIFCCLLWPYFYC